ncbi:UDP-N-acetylmuramoyl-tripeptide--D-alanyl-D-alanine ligase [Aquimarina sp. RZ0]|uniref:UDP-N-acetylmuramoyl-tripeptide--D-alanyl-D- alanine ligase n=1 Tax=Aquimarina sp. RZ0 TaxID=2607730 RepID=UPI0011F2C2C1|nr:UDP-N-acetylmuramoyl-tripeptide--D-alanyl-D-alanine ligase [Aquimarina sp. RZ0]KAA1244788.1 UDP-N-acetylmuramoyl-tripeptide--D-alanyl-D-alanine ligase [Aquimarina sp. RZ0]
MDIAKIHQLFLESKGVCTDTRKIKKQTLFFALKGENFDGNKYANNALKDGASYAIVDDKELTLSENHILVSDVLDTLQSLASYHRTYLNTPIIALTGSNGKTTTKELINCVLSTKYNTTATSGNLNNHIGVPLTLLSMNEETEIGIVEMGANHLKEIEFLCNIAKPDYGYITNIGKAHLEGFGSLEGVLQGKTELYRYLKKNDKLIFLNAEDKKLSNNSIGIKKISFSTKSESDISIQLEEIDPMVKVNYKNTNINSNLIGSYNFTNIAAAITIGAYFNVSPKKIKTAIESYTPANNRSQIITKGKLTIILDAYNANPTSMSAAIDNFEQLGYNTKTVFLGDMFELGKEAFTEHQKIVDRIINTSIHTIYLIGENFLHTSCDDPRVKKYKTFTDLSENWISEQNQTAILIKGSRGMQLERILNLM